MYFPHSDSYQQYSLCEYESDLRSYEHYLSSRETKAWKIFRLVLYMTAFIFTSLSAVQIYDFHIFTAVQYSLSLANPVSSWIIIAHFVLLSLFKLKVDLQPTQKYSFEKNRCIFTIIVRNTIVITLAIVNLLGLVLILDTFLIYVMWVFSFTLLLFWDTTEKIYSENVKDRNSPCIFSHSSYPLSW